MDRRSQLAAGAAFVCTLLVLHFRGAITNQRLGNVAMSSPRTAFRAPAAPPPAVVAPENQTPTQAPPLPTPPAEPTGSCRDDPTHLYPDSCVVQRMSQGGMVTLSTVSTGMVDFVHNLVYSMRVVGADQFVLVAEDEEAFSSLREWLGDAHVLRFPSAVDPGAAHSYNAPGYNKIVSRRPRLLLQLLQSTFSVLYTDVDIVWQRDPYPHLKCDGSYDFAAQADGPLYCTGFIHLCPTEHTRALVKAWAEAMEKKPTLNQYIFNDLAKKSPARGRRLPTQEFQSGDKYFRVGDARSQAAIIHNNFIIGADKKRDRFRKHGMWHPE